MYKVKQSTIFFLWNTLLKYLECLFTGLLISKSPELSHSDIDNSNKIPFNEYIFLFSNSEWACMFIAVIDWYRRQTHNVGYISIQMCFRSQLWVAISKFDFIPQGGTTETCDQLPYFAKAFSSSDACPALSERLLVKHSLPSLCTYTMPQFIKRSKACPLTRPCLFLHPCLLIELPPTWLNIYGGDLKDCKNQDHIHH